MLRFKIAAHHYVPPQADRWSITHNVIDCKVLVHWGLLPQICHTGDFLPQVCLKCLSTGDFCPKYVHTAPSMSTASACRLVTPLVSTQRATRVRESGRPLTYLGQYGPLTAGQEVGCVVAAQSHPICCNLRTICWAPFAAQVLNVDVRILPPELDSKEYRIWISRMGQPCAPHTRSERLTHRAPIHYNVMYRRYISAFVGVWFASAQNGEVFVAAARVMLERQPC
eukprot:SAG11_NODE_5496_length_1544_cov_1.144637_3_plen_225_part_00